MKILLINPPADNIVRESLPPVVEDSTGIYPPLGLLYIAAYVRKIDNCEVALLDCQAESIGHDAIPGRIAEFQPDIVGIQAMTFTLIDAAMTARAARKAAPSSKIVMGGPHPSIYPRETASIPEVDAVVIGEGEYTFSALVKAWNDGTDINSIRGVITRNTPADSPCNIEHIQDLDQLEQPAYDLLDLSLYSSALASHGRVMTMMSSRGCPFQCIFCDRPQMGKVFRKKSAEKVFSEMKYCAEELNIRELIFYDDTFTVDKKRVISLCNLIIDNKLDIAWDIRARVDTIDEEAINLLKKAGCARIHYGIESGSARLQKLIKKNLDLDQVRKAFRITRNAGIETLGYFMIGLPSETMSDLQQTLTLLTDIPMDYAHIGIYTPYPGTQTYREALQTGFYKEDYWRKFAINPTDDFSPRYWTEIFSEEELLAILKDAYRRFYSRPGYILYRLSHIRSLPELIKKAGLGFKLLFDVSKNNRRPCPPSQ